VGSNTGILGQQPHQPSMAVDPDAATPVDATDAEPARE
jgi:hypothetical protein